MTYGVKTSIPEVAILVVDWKRSAASGDENEAYFETGAGQQIRVRVISITKIAWFACCDKNRQRKTIAY